jgi:nitrogen fixation NifU-like protein
MKNTMYTKNVMCHFLHPKNMGEMKKPDASASVGNPRCGDILKIMIKVSKGRNGREVIKDIKFQTFGCTAAIASSSALTELAKGKSVKAAKTISNKDVAHHLHGLPPIKMHCSNLAADALKKAIENWEKKKNQ